MEGELPDGLGTARLDLKSLPGDWYLRKNESLRRFGNEWIRGLTSTRLYLPSAVIRGEWNVLLNPAHSDFEKVTFQKPKSFEFDLRMFR
jgi:RES domain-containing protein